MNLKRLNALLLIPLFLLGGCVKEEVIPEDTSVSIDIEFAQHDFVLAGLPSYVKEKDVYRVEKEEEVALLAYLKVKDEVLDFNYISENELNLDRIYAFLESLLPFSFNLSSSQLNYTKNEEIVLTLYTLHVEPIFEEWVNVDDYALAIVNQAKLKDGSMLEEIKNIHDVIVLNTKYDESVLQLDLTKPSTNLSFDSLGVFLENTAVCSGYSRAFSALSNSLNIPSLIISSETMTHAWNLVYDGSAWKFVDTTFDDPIPDKEGRVLYTYFLLNEKEFIKDGKHIFDKSAQTRLSADEYIDFANYVYFNE